MAAGMGELRHKMSGSLRELDFLIFFIFFLDDDLVDYRFQDL